MSLATFLEKRRLFFEKRVITVIEKKLATNRKHFLLRGPAGVGKTELASSVAQYLNAKLVFFQCTYGTGEDELLYKYVPSEDTKSGIKLTLGPLPLALISSQKQKTVLLIDEFDKTRPSADALLLDFLQNYRLSVYIDERQQVIKGNPENLVVFLTSNDMREFSEPLLRRLTVIQLSHLSATKVFELLKQRFSENIALLLTQIYDDTIKAGLRKPATIQELYELGEFLEQEQSIDLSELLRVFIIKYDDDYQRYLNYIRSRKPYRFVKEYKETEDLSEFYETTEEIVIEEREEKVEKKSVSDVLQRIKVKRTEKTEMNVRQVKEEQEVTMKIEDNDFEAYTEIIKRLRPEPTSEPTRLGKFEVLFDDKRYIVSREPLTFEEIINVKLRGEYYFEEVLFLKEDYRDLIISHAKKITYYTKDRIQAMFKYDDDELILDAHEICKDGIACVVKIRGYLKGEADNFGILPRLRNNSMGLGVEIQHVIKRAVLRGEGIEKIPRRCIQIDSTILKNDDMEVHELQKLIENARRLKKERGVAVKFTTNRHNYNVYIKAHSTRSIELGIGYNYAGKAGYRGKEAEFDIDDQEVDRILERLRGESK